MSTPVTPGVTVTEKINEDGSKTVTTVTINADGSKSTKRKTIRSKIPRGNSPARSKSPVPAHSKSPVPSGGGGSMQDALEAALGGDGHKDDEAFETAVRRCIPSEFLLIASQDDATQAQEAHYAAKLFDLPNPKGQAGSVATSALLQYLYQQDKSVVADKGGAPLSCLKVLQEMHARMNKAAAKFDLQPQISYSRPLGPPRLGSKNYAPFYLVPPNFTGKRVALLIGICFVDDDPSKQLKSPHNDVHNVQQYLTNKCGFSQDDMMILIDGPGATADPTKKNIWASFQKLVHESKPGDNVFIYYSGHGGRMLQPGSTDVFDSYILPSDYKTEGQILDDDLLRDLIKAMPAGVHTTLLVDACSSGTVGDLPYILKAKTNRDQEIEPTFDINTREEILAAEAKGAQELEEYRRAKAERKKQREMNKIQQEKNDATAKAQAEKDATALANQLVGMNTGNPTTIQMMPQAMAAPQTHTFNIKSEDEVAALSQKYGAALSLTPEQKACLGQGGIVTLSFTTQPQQMLTMQMPQQKQTGMIMMTPEQAEAFKKANGGNLMMTPEQAAAFMAQQQRAS